MRAHLLLHNVICDQSDQLNAKAAIFHSIWYLTMLIVDFEGFSLFLTLLYQIEMLFSVAKLLYKVCFLLLNKNNLDPKSSNVFVPANNSTICKSIFVSAHITIPHQYLFCSMTKHQFSIPDCQSDHIWLRYYKCYKQAFVWTYWLIWKLVSATE